MSHTGKSRDIPSRSELLIKSGEGSSTRSTGQRDVPRTIPRAIGCASITSDRTPEQRFSEFGAAPRCCPPCRNLEILLRSPRAALRNFQFNCAGSLDGHDTQIFILRDCPLGLGHRVLLTHDLRAPGFCRSFLTALHLLPKITLYWGNFSLSKDFRIP